MTRHVLALCTTIFVLTSSVAVAYPRFGRDCRICHDGGEPSEGGLEVVNFEGMVDPDESTTGATDRGLAKFFQVQPGGSVDLDVMVDLGTLTDHLYAVELKRMEVPDVQGGGTLVYSPDPDWQFHIGDAITDPNRPYYTIPAEDGIPFTEPRLFTFTIEVDPSTDPGFYDLEFAVAGQPNDFYTDEHFYLHVVPEPARYGLLGLGLGVYLCWRRNTLRIPQPA